MTQDVVHKESVEAPAGLLRQVHFLERWLGRDWVRYVLGRLSAERPGTAAPYLLEALSSYANPGAFVRHKIFYWPIHKILDRMCGPHGREPIRRSLCGYPSVLRGILSTARSLAACGLTVPQRWLTPLFVTWNLTGRCDLRCGHCYQSSRMGDGGEELSLREKLHLIDQFGRDYVAKVVFGGGEPLLSGDLETCVAHCRRYGIYTSLATHGGLLSRQRCRDLARAGLDYAEFSLDSTDPERHDRWRGVAGAWQRAAAGIRNMLAAGVKAGIAMCVTRRNVHEVEPMLAFAAEQGASCFSHMNFVPVGRGADMAEEDLLPQEREDLLATLRRWMNSGRIRVVSTAPQLGRLCVLQPDETCLVFCSHTVRVPGVEVRAAAKYLGGCGAGRTYVCVQPNGDVTPCVYMPDRVMGNVREKPFAEVFRQNPWWDLFCNRDEREGFCGTCDYRTHCGGCRARADAYFNRVDHSDPGCIYNCGAWERLTQPQTALVSVVQTHGSNQHLFRHIKLYK